MILNFRLSERGTVQFPFAGPEKLGDVLHQYGGGEGDNLSGYIAVRQGKVITADDLIIDGDEIELFPAISGG